MGIFSSIMDKLRGHAQGSTGTTGTQASAGGSAQGQQSQYSNTQTAQQGGAPQSGMPQGGTTQQGGAQQAGMQNVDVEAILTKLGSQKGGGGNWRTSIVDLLKLLDLDSSLEARKQLGQELNVHAGADGSAEQNIALHKAVMAKIAENGGKVPESMRH
ncbi:MAG TPA: DUF3597 domain-containing protein [Usitatibacter sp.]|nr:DUF3597 domain-containing protein [Usitatibacter sp.]